MKYTRKSFLKMSGALALGAVPFLKACAPSASRQISYGIQLYTLRDIIGEDPQGTIRTLAEYGYNQIESYEGLRASSGTWGIKISTLSWMISGSVWSQRMQMCFRTMSRRWNSLPKMGYLILPAHISGIRDQLMPTKRWQRPLTGWGKLPMMPASNLPITTTPIPLKSWRGRFLSRF